MKPSSKTSSKLAAQPECAKHRPTGSAAQMSTADKVRASLLVSPGRS